MPPNPGDPKAEIARLKAKMATIQDRDIRAAIQERVDILAAQVVDEPPLSSGGEGSPEEIKAPEGPPAPPTPAQAEQAERLVRQAMLEKQRGNKAAVTKLLQEAVEVAPGAPTTLEALGDDFAGRGRTKEAMDCYRRAIALDPKNVGLDRKHAMLVLNVGMAGSIEDQLRANLSESIFINQSDAVASYSAAKFANCFVPGLGHVLLGRPGLGFGLIGGWVACVVWLVIAQKATGGNGHIGNGVALPILAAVGVWIAAAATLGADRAAARPKGAVNHPKPPVDLPYD